MMDFGVQVLIGLALAYLEYSGRFNMPYSKFAKGGPVRMRAAALAAYLAPILVYVALWRCAGAPRSPYHLALLAGFTLHFAKRCLESLFLHKFSKSVGWRVLLLVGGMYAAVASTAARANPAPAPPDSWLLPFGAALMLAGELANLHHHRLLAGLRAVGETGYRVPRGGLFERVACPHYLAELVAWLGFALMARRLETFGLLFIFACYLAARSARTSAWYKANVPDYPAERKALIPGLF